LLSSFAGLHEQSLEYADIALRLSPRDPLAFRIYLARALAHLCVGDYDAVLENTELGLNLNPRALVLHRYKVISLALLGRSAEAKNEKERFLQPLPNFTIGEYVASMRDERGAAEALWRPTLDGLTKAGYPE
jgi:adenylate cyclase